ncbi:MAG TPA: AAC(3) family N-acetyltransferase [Polyangiaceae bacterium]|jgi:aminoglycoside 3-N-acetyltransferase
MNVNQIMAVSPYVEVAVRNIYWRSEFLVRKVTAMRGKRPDAKQPLAVRIAIGRVLDNLARRGVAEGDILVVHSGYKAVSVGNTPRAVNEALRALVGPEGTLVMPAIRLFADVPSGVARMKADVSTVVSEYDPDKTPVWTGVLPVDLLKVPEAHRSLHPLNSVVAWGPHAEAMMRNNLEAERALPCGPGSSWNYCREHGAKIAAVGVDMCHNLTMIHVAEDMQGERWCVPGWYRERRFRIRTKAEWEEHTVRERHPRWAMHYAERTLDKDLRREGLLTVEDVDGVPVSLLDAGALVEYLNSRNASGYPYYVVPSRR